MRQSLLYLCFVIAFLMVPSEQAAPQAKQADGERLKFVLVLTRHGVRSPTWTNARLDEYSKDPWPKWDVAPGLLTAHGKALMTQFGAFYRLKFSELGLLSRGGCTDAGRVFIYADSDERTRETGRGIADGMFPGCAVEVHSLGEGAQDPLFHSDGQSGRPAIALATVAGRIGGDPSALLPAYDLQLNTMQQVLSGCAQPGCPSPARRDLLAIAPSLTLGSGDHLVEMKGPLTTGATFAENFQLEYLEGMPEAQVGWGRVNEEIVRSLMAIHAASSDIVQRSPYIASVQASNLLIHLLRTMQQAEQQKAVAGAIGSPQEKVVFLVGHDTNISNVAALLDAHWLVNGYQRDDAAPGGALVFELWQNAGHEDVVHVYYTVQTTEQMRKSFSLSLARPPAQAMVSVPGCATMDSYCDWSRFRQLIESVADPAFVR